MEWLSAIATLLALGVILAFIYRYLGDYMAWAFTSDKDWGAERGFYRLIGVDAKAEQTWPSYLRALLAFSIVGMLIVYLLQRIQHWLPYSLGMPAVPPALSFNTAASFVANTNWQSYSPEQTVGYSVQLAGLAIQNFVSAAVGIAVAVALVRAFVSRKQPTIGNFWVDVTRSTLRVLVPIAIIGAIILMAGGVIQNFHDFTHVTTLAGNAQQIPGGPAASQEVIKLLGTNGGGFFNANSAHPFENPTAWTNLFEVVLMLCVPFALPRTFGKMVGDNRQGYAILAAMAVIYIASYLTLTAVQLHGHGTAPQAAGGAWEGIEQRLGIVGSSIFSTTSTTTSTGAVSAMHDSYTSLGGMMTMLNMMLGEVTPGGTGTGLYGILVDAVIAVFVAGLLVGRTPEYLGKKIGPREIKLASLYILVTPTLVLAGTALSFGIPGVKSNVANTSILNPGVHGMSEVLYAFTSGANNNGSAFAGLTANTYWMNTSLGAVMLLGRFVPIVLVLALAGSLAAQTKVPETAGTLPTHRPMFIGLLIGVILIVTALTYFPVLTLGPLAEGL